MGVDFFKSRTEYTEEGWGRGGQEGEIPMDRFGESDSHVHYGLPAWKRGVIGLMVNQKFWLS